ncbi:MAG: IMPACT family protein [Candidatus Cryptobacteroides sp.]
MALLADEYLSVPGSGEGIYKDRGSRFIARAYPVATEDEVKAVLEVLRREFHDARHHCYAYRLGLKADRYRANDDGEPSGSAGRPILGQLESRGLSDVLVVVVRYFGGIKLGVPGLIKAYRTSASDALDAAGTIVRTASVQYSLSFGYDALPQVMNVIKDMGLGQLSQDFGLDCTLRTCVRLTKEEDFLRRISDIRGVVATAL